jgi:indole-3-glycerol phosphate synthase
MNILQQIISHKIKELSAVRLNKKGRDVDLSRLTNSNKDNQFGRLSRNKTGSFATAIKKNPRQRMPHIIAEIKKSSPSKGQLLQDGQITDIAKIYESSGVAAISVLTDQKFFGGTIDDLTQIKNTVKTPLLRKDFIFTKHQITAAANAGASAVLLMVTVMTLLTEDYDSLDISDSLDFTLRAPQESAELQPRTPTQLLQSLIEYAHSLELEVLVETHSAAEIEIAVAAGAKIIGVNSRDFADLSIDLSIFLRLLPLIPDGIIRVAESGIYSREDMVPIADLCDAVLIGSSLMESGVDGIEDKIKSFI